MVGGFPPAAVGFLMIGQALTPPGLDQPILGLDTAQAELQVAAFHSGRLYLATCFVLLGLGALAAAFVAIATLCTGRRGSTTAAAAAALAALACLCGIVVNSLVGLNLAGASRTSGSKDAAAQVLLAVNTVVSHRS